MVSKAKMMINKTVVVMLLMLCVISVVILNVSYMQVLVELSDSPSNPDEDKMFLKPKKKRALISKTPMTTTRAENENKKKATAILGSANGTANISPTYKDGEIQTDSLSSNQHTVAGLSCERYGGPSDEIAAEMVYWRDIPKDAKYKSPFANYGPNPKYLTFEPDIGGWNNIRMSMGKYYGHCKR